MSRNAPINILSFEARCLAQAAAKTLLASQLPLGIERDQLERESSQYKTASHMQSWLASPGLRSPS